MIRKTILIGAAAAICGRARRRVRQAQDRVVNVYNWSDYIDDSLLAEFTEKTGIRVVYDVFDSNEILETRLLAGGSGYDVVVPTGSFLARQIQAGVFQELDKSKLPNLDNMWDVVERARPTSTIRATTIRSTTCGARSASATMSAWSQERLGTDEIDSWDVVFDPENLAKLADCGIYFLDSPDRHHPDRAELSRPRPQHDRAGRSRARPKKC